MKQFDFLLPYTKLAPLQLALIRAEEAFRMSQVEMPQPILDIGCSDGIFGEVLFRGKRGAIDIGVDIDETALALAKDRAVYRKTIKADARSLPFADRTFAMAFSNQGLEHIKDIDKVLEEVNRVLREKGKFGFLVPTIFLDEYWLTSAPFRRLGLTALANFLHEIRNRIFGHYNLLPVAVWREKIEEHGFKLEKHQYLGSRRRYFLSEFFWPFRIPEMLATRLLGREVLFPRGLAIWMARLLEDVLEDNRNRNPEKGPTMLIVAQKIRRLSGYL